MQIWDERNKEVCLPLHNAEGAPRTFLWCGWPTVFNHLPFANLLEKQTHVLRRCAWHSECAVHKSAEKHACGEVCICTSRSDRESLAHHHAIGLPKPQPLISKLFSVSGRVFRFADGEPKKNTILSTTNLTCFPLRQVLQSCHCQLKYYNCVTLLSLCRRTCCRCQSLTFWRSRCLAVCRCAPEICTSHLVVTPPMHGYTKCMRAQHLTSSVLPHFVHTCLISSCIGAATCSHLAAFLSLGLCVTCFLSSNNCMSLQISSFCCGNALHDSHYVSSCSRSACNSSARHSTFLAVSTSAPGFCHFASLFIPFSVELNFNLHVSPELQFITALNSSTFFTRCTKLVLSCDGQTRSAVSRKWIGAMDASTNSWRHVSTQRNRQILDWTYTTIDSRVRSISGRTVSHRGVHRLRSCTLCEHT